MPVRFRILPAAREVRAAWAAAGASAMAEGPSEERGFEIAADLDELRIGRQPDVEIELPFPAVSTLHARLLRGELAADWSIEDLGSLNGSWLDGQRLVPRRAVPIRSGQRLRIATVDLIFEGWSPLSQGIGQPGGLEGTATIARRLISDLFGAVGGEVPRLVVQAGVARPDQRDLALSVRDRRYLVGRAESCDLVLAGEHVSREHAAFIRRTDGVVLQDLGSRNGLVVNGQPVSGERRLGDGDIVTVGTASLRLTDPEDRYLRRLEALAPAAASPPPPSSPAFPQISLAPQSPAQPAAASPVASPAGAQAAPPASSADTPLPPATAQGGARSANWLRPPRTWQGFATALVAAIAVTAIAGLIALWLVTH